jgi:uncharacterized protein YegL
MKNVIDFKKLQICLLLDISGSQDTPDGRLNHLKEVGLQLGQELCEIDQNSKIRVITFGGRVIDYGELVFDKIKEIFSSIVPNGTTPLDEALLKTIPSFENHLTGYEKLHHLIIVITDGEPDDKKLVIEAIQQIATYVTSDDQLAIQFVQVGNDQKAAKYLQILDDDISQYCDGKDIVNTIHFSQITKISLETFVQLAFDD